MIRHDCRKLDEAAKISGNARVAKAALRALVLPISSAYPQSSATKQGKVPFILVKIAGGVSGFYPLCCQQS